MVLLFGPIPAIVICDETRQEGDPIVLFDDAPNIAMRVSLRVFSSSVVSLLLDAIVKSRQGDTKAVL
jgi:hypothetical protein